MIIAYKANKSLVGHGYIREWGQEQLVRDARIAQIYEGTNGIQALDLMGRKTVANSGKLFKLFADEVRSFLDSSDSEKMTEFHGPLLAALTELEGLTAHVVERSQANPNEVGAASVEYLHAFGYVAYAYMWGKMASVAYAQIGHGDDQFYQGKLSTARYFFKRILPRVDSLAKAVRSGAAPLFELEVEQF